MAKVQRDYNENYLPLCESTLAEAFSDAEVRGE